MSNAEVRVARKRARAPCDETFPLRGSTLTTALNQEQKSITRGPTEKERPMDRRCSSKKALEKEMLVATRQACHSIGALKVVFQERYE
jgi:hypothetical protein